MCRELGRHLDPDLEAVVIRQILAVHALHVIDIRHVDQSWDRSVFPKRWTHIRLIQDCRAATRLFNEARNWRSSMGASLVPEGSGVADEHCPGDGRGRGRCTLRRQYTAHSFLDCPQGPSLGNTTRFLSIENTWTNLGRLAGMTSAGDFFAGEACWGLGSVGLHLHQTWGRVRSFGAGVGREPARDAQH